MERIARQTLTLKLLSRKHWRLALRKAHFFIGVSFGLLFVLLGVTGGLLVFEHEIDEWLNPELLRAGVSVEDTLATRAPYRLDEMLAAVSVYRPEFEPQRLEAPRLDAGVYLFRGNYRNGNERQPLDILVDPGRRLVLGERVWGEYTMSFIYKLHYTLLSGKTGSAIVGIAGLMLLVMTISGLILWWPKKGKWRQAIGVKWRAKKIRVIWDLHRSLGFFSSTLLIVITVSGIYMIFPQYIKPVVNWVSPLTPMPVNVASSPALNTEPIGLNRAADIADEVFPGAELKRIYFPQGLNGVYRVIKRELDSPMKSGGYFQVWIDQYSGEVLAIRSPEMFTAGDNFVALQFPLHNGEALGLFGRLLILSVSLIPLFLLVSGLWIWGVKKLVLRASHHK